MVRPDNLESTSFTRQGKSAGGSLRGLPNLGARGAEIRRIHLNGQFNPAVTPGEIKSQLLNPSVYGEGGRLRFFEGSRNNRHPHRSF